MISLIGRVDERDLRRAVYHTTVGNGEFLKLAFIGDAVLNLYFTQKFYGIEDVGLLSRLVSEYKSNRAFYITVKELNLDSLLVADKSAVSEYTYASMFEAMVGLLYEKFPMEEIFKFLDKEVFPIMEKNYNKFRNYWEEARIKLNLNEKNVVVEEKSSGYFARISINGKTFVGEGKSKREAKNNAAKVLMIDFDYDMAAGIIHNF